MFAPAPQKPPVGSFEAKVDEFASATGHHYLHSSLETLARFESARADLLRARPPETAPGTGPAG